MRIVVTRPKRSGEKTAALLEGMGHTPVLLPLSIPHHDPAVALAGLSAKPAALAVTSAEAIHGLELLGEALAPFFYVPVFAVGEATSIAAKNAGFKDILVADGDGEKLVALIEKKRGMFANKSRPLLYLAGLPRSPALETGLSRSSIPFQTLECYRMQPVQWTEDELDAHFLTGPVDIVLFYSGEAVRIFFKAVSAVKYGHLLHRTRFICISQKVAALVPSPFRANTSASAAPNEMAMLALLDDVKGT